MKKTICFYINARLLCSNEDALKRVCSLLAELEEKGYIEDGRLVFDEQYESEIKEIFDHNLTSKSPIE